MACPPTRRDFNLPWRLSQAKSRELAQQFFRQILADFTDRTDIAWRILGLQIAPALKRSTRLGMGAHELGLEPQAATPDPLLVGKGLDIDQLLAHQNDAANDPIERTA